MSELKDFFVLLSTNVEGAIAGFCIIISAIVTIVGILKEFFANKITNKLLRKIVLAALSIIIAYPVTALYFWAAGISFTYYVWGCICVCLSTILSYWVYENTGLRNLMNYIGKKFILLVATSLAEHFSKGNINKENLNGNINNLKTETVKEVNKTLSNVFMNDDELKKL